jgi:hypothetical protein
MLFGACWRIYGEYQGIRFVPMAVVLAADLAFLGAALAHGAVRVLSGTRRDAPAPMTLNVLVVVLVVLLIKLAFLLSLPRGAYNYPWSWRNQINWIYPQPIYRPLILMALWGRWGISLALTIGCVAPQASARLKRMAAGQRLSGTLLQWLLCAALTMVYASAEDRHLPLGLVIALAVLVGSYLVSFALARTGGGQTESSVLAAGLATELLFLALYVPMATLIYWY